MISSGNIELNNKNYTLFNEYLLKIHILITKMFH